MSPKQPMPKFQLPSRTVADSDAAFAALEHRTELRGHGVAGQPLPSASVHIDVQTSDRTSIGDAIRTSEKSIVKRRGGRLRRRRTVYLPTDLDAALEKFCTASGREISETVAGALELYLASRR